MNKKQLRKKTWEHFWLLKLKEVCFIFGGFIVAALISKFGRWMDAFLPSLISAWESGCITCYSFWHYVAYFFFGVASIAFILAVPFSVGYIIYIIINANWKHATKLAKEDLRGKK